MQLTEEQIKKINKECPYNQGIFVEPYGIPVTIKEPVIYCRYETGGFRGGSCYGGNPTHYTEDVPKDKMMVLDLVLQELCPDLTFLQFRQVERLIDYNTSYTEQHYYGNSTDWKIEFIRTSELYKLLESFKKTK